MSDHQDDVVALTAYNSNFRCRRGRATNLEEQETKTPFPFREINIKRPKKKLIKTGKEKSGNKFPDRSEMLLMIDGPMINRFIDDVDNFQQCADERFHELDADSDGLLSRGDLGRKLSGSVGLDHQTSSDHQLEDGKEKDIDDLVFDKFDVDGNGSIDREEFWPMMREILNALARGIGSMPVIVGVEKDSLLMKAYENELARIDCKLDKVIESNGIEIIGRRGRNLKKKRSKKILINNNPNKG